MSATTYDLIGTSVLAEAKMCCSGQPVMLVGDLNADPSVIHSLADGMADGAWIDVEQASANGREYLLHPLVNFNHVRVRASSGTLHLLAPLQ